MPVPAEISQLVELFERNYDQYRAPAFTEAAVRHQFIDPFFAALVAETAQASTCMRGWPWRESRTIPKGGRAPAADRDE
jgi:hypothetical protein